MGLKTRIQLVVLALLLAGIWGLAARVTVAMQDDLEKVLADQMSSTVHFVASDLDSAFQMRIDALDEIAATISPAALANPAKLQEHLERHVAAKALFPNGVVVADKRGIIVAAYPQVEGRTGTDISDRAYFRDTMTHGRTSIGAPMLSRFLKQPFVAIAMPIRDGSGNVAAVMIGPSYLSDRSLFGQIEQTRLGASGYFVVMSPRDNLIVSATDKTRIMTPMPAKGVNPLLDRRIETGFDEAGINVSSRGVENLSVSRRLKTTGWIVVAAVPTEEVYAPIATLKRQIYVAALLLSLVVMLILRFVLARQLSPLVEAGDAMRRMTDGEEAFAPIPVRRNDEIGHLVDNFNRLVVERQSTEQALRESESRYQDLTSMSSDWLWEQDAQFRFSEMSYGLSITRLNPAKTLGKTRWELPILEVSDARWQAHRRLLERHEPFKDFVYQIETTPGELRWFSIAGNPVFGRNGEFVGYRGVGTDITERKTAEQQVEYLAYRDTLTGLPNRLLLNDRFEQAKAYADRSRTKVALLFLDLDNFKTINDSLGHGVGDHLLKEIAARLSEGIRDTDTVSRQGGDEFLILLSDLADADTIPPILAKLVKRLQETFWIDGHELSTSISVGVALYPDDGKDFHTLLKKADMAMYRAKDAGRNTYRFFDEQMNVEAVEHLAVRNGLRRALEHDEFVLHYQPQIDLGDGRVTGVEALIRWRHPDLGLIAPGRFIAIAEDSGLIVPIGEWVVHEACRQAAAWKLAGLPDMQVAVNLSAVQFKRGDVVQAVTSALDASGFNPAFLELELTESILIGNTESVLATVQRLKLLGVRLSIDDFGTGYSSLSYLKRFDVDKLKIDQSFIRDLSSDPEDAAIVRAIIQMAQSLSLTTIAEGVEDAQMLDHLRSFRCDGAQGYHFARPMPADELVAFLGRPSSEPG
ncbi:MAG: EAL domain-containing protein [Sterolibacterium sp.]|jgi:diguanylate cyclase (GGDEF)-like protein/PAS domain S-box-containing protein